MSIGGIEILRVGCLANRKATSSDIWRSSNSGDLRLFTFVVRNGDGYEARRCVVGGIGAFELYTHRCCLTLDPCNRCRTTSVTSPSKSNGSASNVTHPAGQVKSGNNCAVASGLIDGRNDTRGSSLAVGIDAQSPLTVRCDAAYDRVFHIRNIRICQRAGQSAVR